MSQDKALADVVSDYSEIVAAWIFGSVARGEARDDSDLDLAVLLRDPCSCGIRAPPP